ncbi:hypothetical protein PAPYR_6553 [Paratrimastix pyriformis]|uniref:Peptidase A2 domain-containing protein n=1 Tax=Paratrimastix pyriformis TaxID=342808 RepID=A0ABQ8UF52_9EUKA|nr:hypothetical protein PAPYR_6553 [Paratrimastix pyriformis]
MGDIAPIIDTGASISTCSREILEELDVPCEPVPPSKRISVATPDGNVFSPDYFANIAVEIPGGKEKAITRTVKFYVVTPVDESPAFGPTFGPLIPDALYKVRLGFAGD